MMRIKDVLAAEAKQGSTGANISAVDEPRQGQVFQVWQVFQGDVSNAHLLQAERPPESASSNYRSGFSRLQSIHQATDMAIEEKCALPA